MNITTEPIRNKKTLQELFNLLKGQNERNYVLAVTQLNTALRVSDIQTLKVQCFMHPNGRFRKYIVLKEKKTHKGKHITVNSALKNVLSSYIKNNNLSYDDYLFPGKFGQSAPLSKTQIHRIYQKAAKILNIECFNSHSLRKTWGHDAYKNCKDIALIMQIYGHTSISHTFRYIGIEQDKKDKLYNTITYM